MRQISISSDTKDSHLAALALGTRMRRCYSLGSATAGCLWILLLVCGRLPWGHTLKRMKHATLGGYRDCWSHAGRRRIRVGDQGAWV